ncbi:SNF2 family N-terminal domain-containing protein [Mycena leptocephala]|nr:SNF2 family N-terminal domain-containing protein [Mycena leptocephala]
MSTPVRPSLKGPFSRSPLPITPNKPRYVEIDDLDSTNGDVEYNPPEVDHILQTQPYISPIKYRTFYESREWQNDDDDQAEADPKDLDSLLKILSGECVNKGLTLRQARSKLGMAPDSWRLPGLDVVLMRHQITGIATCIDQENSTYAGGILADEMGREVGLIDKNPSQDPDCKTTLIVSPLAVLGHWEEAFDKVTEPGKLTLLVYHGPQKAKHAETLLQKDIVLTTYGTLLKQYETGQSTQFYRIILDEAHWIRNRPSKRLASAVALQGKYRWGLSGTPMINCLWDFYAFFLFLRIPYWHDLSSFKRSIANLEAKNPTLAVKKIQEILSFVMLRRLKSTIIDGEPLLQLPEKKVVLTRLEFSQEERQIYDMLEFCARDGFNYLLDNDLVSKKMMHVLTLLLRLRQVCSHPALVKSHVGDGDHRALQTRITDFLTGNQKLALQEIELEESDDDEDFPVENYVAPSTKMRYFMMKLISQVLEEHPTEKIIVISQWTQLLSLAAKYLEQSKITYLRYQGDLGHTQRELTVHRFMKEEGTEPVMLLSLLCGGTGLNLTRANHIICLDLGWSHAVENQVFDRVHRPGQTRPVFIHRIVIADTVEDRILALQERKQNLADGSLNEGNGKSLRELAILFGLNAKGFDT